MLVVVFAKHLVCLHAKQFLPAHPHYLELLLVIGGVGEFVVAGGDEWGQHRLLLLVPVLVLLLVADLHLALQDQEQLTDGVILFVDEFVVPEPPGAAVGHDLLEFGVGDFLEEGSAGEDGGDFVALAQVQPFEVFIEGVVAEPEHYGEAFSPIGIGVGLVGLQQVGDDGFSHLVLEFLLILLLIVLELFL